MVRTRLMHVTAICTLLLLLAACDLTEDFRAEVGETVTDTVTVEREGAERVTVEVDMAAGELDVAGGAANLLEATFTSNVAAWEPEVAYEVTGGLGELSISQPVQESLRIPDGDVVYRWELRLDDTVATEMNVDIGAGDNRLDLSALDLRRFALTTGAGQVEVSLPGTLSEMDVNAGAGDVMIDMSELWEQDLDAEIRAGVGRLTLLLPADAGVRVETDQAVGDLETIGLQQEGEFWVNEALGDSPVTLDIDVASAVGQIVLRVVE